MALLTPSIITLQVNSKNTTEFVPGTGESNGQLTLSDHSRSPLQTSFDTIESPQRMADGTMRKYVIANKKRVSCSWTMLPTISSMVVDGKANALAVKRFYEINYPYDMTMKLYYKKNAAQDLSYVETISIYWESMSFDVVKRYNDFDYWNINAEFVEI
jgi:hypothetical protein